MTEEESIEIFKNWLEYNKKHKNILREADKIIAVQETILNLIQRLQKRIEELEEENKELMKLRYELFNSIPKAKIIEEKGARKHIMEEYKKKWIHKDEKYYKTEIEFYLLQELLKDGGN